MKTLKKTTLAAIAILTLNSAIAQTDPVIQQISITQDAVKVALEEMAQGKDQAMNSADGAEKMRLFSEDASRALVRFEEAVRVRVLQSFSVLVNQYNRTLANRALGDAQNEVLSSLRTQMDNVAKDKSLVYREAYLELFSVLPDMPVQYDRMHFSSDYNNSNYVESGYEYKKVNPSCVGFLSGGCDHDYLLYFDGDLYFSKSKTKKISGKFVSDDRVGVMTAMERLGAFSRNSVRPLILEGCFTSSCFFVTQSQYTIWNTMVNSSLARNIDIKLNDGKTITITKDIARNGQVFNLVSSYLSGIKTEGLINDLPLETSPERFAILKRMDSQMRTGKCRDAKKASVELCQTTREGCLVAAEKALFVDRHGRAASCL